MLDGEEQLVQLNIRCHRRKHREPVPDEQHDYHLEGMSGLSKCEGEGELVQLVRVEERDKLFQLDQPVVAGDR